MTKLNKNFLAFTFSIMLVCWGACIVFSLNGIFLSDNKLLYLLFLLGGWSPSLASYIALRKVGVVNSIKEWIVNIFDFKHNVISYTIIIIFSFAYIFPQILISGYKNGAPFHMILVMIPIMLIYGGLEEVGWRYILQQELEKKLNFTLSTIIVSIIWGLWHLPLFFINGVSQYRANYLFFFISVIGLSFALASIRKNTNSVWLCILFHCIINSLSGIFIVFNNLAGTTITALILIAMSYILNMVKEFNKVKIE